MQLICDKINNQILIQKVPNNTNQNKNLAVEN